MRRSNSVIGLAATLAAAAITTLIYNIDLRHSQRADNSANDEAGYEQENLPTIATADESATDVELQPSLADDRESAVTALLSDSDDIPRRSVADEEASAKWVREDAMREVPKRYSLIIERLGLSASEIDALLEVLIEDWIASTRTRYSSGEGMDGQERVARIAAIIGDTKLQQFLALERNIRQHAEVLYIQDVFQKHEAPMTPLQRDRMLEILIEIQNQDLVVPGAEAERGSIERLEYQLAKIDERERLVFEQAAGVLSAEQVGYLFGWYQRDSYRRADALERQKKTRADDSPDDLPLHYPGRTDPDRQQ